MTQPTLRSSYKCAGGQVQFFSHTSRACNGEMRFSVFLPPRAEREPVPVVYWLSGLTCTEENFMVKAGAQRHAAGLGLMLVAPDTSPRGLGLAGEDDAWDFGSGAGFYLNATRAPWSDHYHMYDYVVEELPALIRAHFPASPGRAGICGHSMGGHGAMVIALRNPDRYCSVSAFSPICAPSNCPWGEKAFANYLGEDRDAWGAYDSCTLLARMSSNETKNVPTLMVDQGDADNFLTEQLKTELLAEVCARRNLPLKLRMLPGYDHSFYFIASFIGEHLAHHAAARR